MVSRAWATHSSASRWRGPGTPARKLSTNCPTTSGAAPNSNGTTSPAAVACRCESTSTRSESASGWPCESSSIHPRCSSATPALRRKACASSGVEVAQGNHAQQVAPSGILAPRCPGSVPARHDDQRTTPAAPGRIARAASPRGRRQPRRCPAADSRLAAGKRLPRRRLCGQPERAPELGHERRRRRLDRTNIEVHDAHVGLRRRLAERTHQRGLANPARTADPQHAELRFRRSERPRNSSSSAARPTNRRRRALFKRSATVDAGGGSNESCRVVGDILSYGA